MRQLRCQEQSRQPRSTKSSFCHQSDQEKEEEIERVDGVGISPMESARADFQLLPGPAIAANGRLVLYSGQDGLHWQGVYWMNRWMDGWAVDSPMW